jgi:hypothetical protein
MFARAPFRFLLARFCASSRPPAKPFIPPTYERFTSNSFVSPTYAKTGGCTPSKMSARRHFPSLFSQTPLSAFLLFNHLRTLSFSVSILSPTLPISSALLPQKSGVHPLRSNQSHGSPPKSDRVSSLWAVDCWLVFPLAPPLPFTAHSQSCYRTFTHLCLALVTMFPGPGSHTNTMSIAISPRTVHFYQCDPLREMPS